MNQLVRGGVDFDGFRSWYDSLPVPERCVLIGLLIEFAYQTWFDKQTYKEAVSAAQVAPDNPIVVHAVSQDEFIEYVYQESHFGHDWLMQLTGSDRFTVFSLFVHLFGKGEEKRYQMCKQTGCYHWWHRDLLDERVVQSILSDPQFYMTSMEDDELVKRP